MVPLERRFRKAYHLHTHLDYVDFLFKIDRIVDMLTTFVNCVKKDIRNTYGSLHDISSIPLNFPISNENYTITVTYSQLTQILNEADKVVSACMKLFHWKAYKEYYFEEMYLEIPEELPRIRENYQICAKLCNALQNSSMNDEDLNHLFSKLNCYYCDKLSAACYYSRRFSNKNVLLHSVHNNTGVIDSKNENDKCDKYDQQVIERALFAYGELFNRLPAYLQQDEKLLMIALQKGLPLNKLVRNYAFESPNSAVQNKLFLKAVDIMLEDYDFAFGIISTLAYRRSRLSCIAYYVKRRLTSTKLLDEDPSKYTKYNCLFVDWEMMYLIFRADCYSARSSATTACATHFVNVLMKLENGEVDGVNICIPSLSPEAKNYIIRHNKKFFYSLYW
ncbi:hypothetical protein C9374_012146 [Naegleria lovaniensis]|uniref:Uncharacterized protein n=1 Tax=Naegleria lovaniensis TaxID=51637 RepID=A0AA88GD57_NAELO|nr:uncharacterized protein C9374_012146 [Naegleria lovaniensis]KAG2373407.1 hypothetical protein C9374_012146 [Naegleria lovaniensis]